MDREAKRAVIHGVTKSRTRLSYWTILNWADVFCWRNKYNTRKPKFVEPYYKPDSELSVLYNFPHYFLPKVKRSEVTQLCPTLRDPVDANLPGSTVHGIFQARTLEWAAISFSKGSSQPRDRNWISCIADRPRGFTVWATRKPCSILLSLVFISCLFYLLLSLLSLVFHFFFF